MTDRTETQALDTLRRRMNSIEDYSKEYLVGQIEARDERIDDLEDRIDRLEEVIPGGGAHE